VETAQCAALNASSFFSLDPRKRERFCRRIHAGFHGLMHSVRPQTSTSLLTMALAGMLKGCW
jgi:hypothetical protein